MNQLHKSFIAGNAIGTSHRTKPLLAILLISFFACSQTIYGQLLIASNTEIFVDNDNWISAYSSTVKSKHSVTTEKTTDLEFGGVFNGFTPGTVIIDPDPSKPRTSSGGVILNTRQPGCPAVIRLTIRNEDHCKNDDHELNDDNECDRDENDDHYVKDEHFGFSRHGVWNTIVLSKSTNLKRTDGTETMTADSYVILRTKGTIYIGSTLHVAANQKRGRYSGAFTITAACD